jgi:prepilin-type N-terminal cleavage/methylation domain-containing protein
MKKGFTLVELLIAIFILQISLLAFFSFNQSSNNQSMNAYYKFMAFSLAKETIDYCHGMGYDWAIRHLESNSTRPFPLSNTENGEWHSIKDYYLFSKNIHNEQIDVNDAYISESVSFKRRVELKKIASPRDDGRAYDAVLVTVQLKPDPKSRAAQFLGNEIISFSSTIMEIRI